MEFIIGFFAFLIGLFIGFQYAANMAGKALGTMLHEFGVTDRDIARKAEELGIDVSRYVEEIEAAEAEDESVIELVVERVGDAYYAYRWETDEFLAQSTTPAELLEELIRILPKDTRVNIDIERGGIFFKDLA
jgi:hypothetical protein